MSERLTLYFTRHGESVANTSDREGVKRPPDADRLSERGWEQARGVAAREGKILVVSFHPEIAGERRIHELFLKSLCRT